MNRTMISKRSVIAIICPLSMTLFIGSAQGDILSATLTVDTMVNSGASAFDYQPSNRRAVGETASYAAATLLRFDLPLLPANHVVSEVALTMTYLDESQPINTLAVGSITPNPALTGVTWDSAVGAGLIASASAPPISWGPDVTLFSQTWSLPAASVNDAYGMQFTYTDTTLGDGLVQYIQNNISELSINPVTLVLSGTNLTQFTQFCGSPDSHVDYRPQLTIMTQPIPEPPAVILSCIGAVAASLCVARRHATSVTRV